MTMTESTNPPTRFKPVARPACFALLLALGATLLTTAPCRGQADPVADDGMLLTPQRWRDYAYGLSMRLPANARILERVMDDSVPWTLGDTSRANQAVFQNLAQRFTLDRIRADLKRDIHATGEFDQLPLKDPSLEGLLRDPWAGKTNEQMLKAIAARKTVGSKDRAVLLSFVDDGALLRVEGDITYVMRLLIRQVTKGTHINIIAGKVVGAVGTDFPSAILTTEKAIEVAGRQGALLYYKIPDKDKGDAALGQALIEINDGTYAILRFDAPFVLFEDVRTIFEAVLNSIKIRPPEQLAEQRRVNLERGKMWRQMISAKQLHEVTGDTQLLRILQGGEDIGFMAIETRPATELNLPGLAVNVQARVLVGFNAQDREHVRPYVQDTQSTFYLSDDDTQEIWKINTTARLKPQLDKPRAAEKQLTWAETGVRSDGQVKVFRPGVAARKQQAWSKPDAYLSQVDLHLMGRLLPHKKPMEFGFYAYLPAANKISYRTVRVEPTPDGGYMIYTRATPEYGESVAQYDKDRKLIGRLLSGGRALIPTTTDELERLWKAKPTLRSPAR